MNIENHGKILLLEGLQRQSGGALSIHKSRAAVAETVLAFVSQKKFDSRHHSE